MVIHFGVYVAIAAIGILALLFLSGLRGRGRLIECPECGERFKRPALTEKSSGIGFSLPGMGDYTCPKCNYRGSTSNFRYVDSSDESETGSKI